MAEAANLHPNHIRSVERGERNISIGNIEQISVALGVSMIRKRKIPVDLKDWFQHSPVLKIGYAGC